MRELNNNDNDSNDNDNDDKKNGNKDVVTTIKIARIIKIMTTKTENRHLPETAYRLLPRTF